MRVLLILMLCWFANFPAVAFAQPDLSLELTQKTREEVIIAVQTFSPKGDTKDPAGLAEEYRAILENDLRLSEYFILAQRTTFHDVELSDRHSSTVDYPTWHRLGVQWFIKTEFEINPKNKTFSVVFRLFDASNERFLFGKQYTGTIDSARKIIHRFADEVVEQLTGKHGVAETRIAFVSKQSGLKEIYLVDFDGYNVERLTKDESVSLSPAWSPTGKKIIYTSYAERNPDLMMIDIFNKKRKPILRLPGLNAAPAWSSDGVKIALVLSKDSNSEIYVLDKNMELTRLTHHFNIDTSPAWSPNGKQIAFTSDRSGTGVPQIYIMDAQKGDEAKVERITFDSSYNDNPAWSPDGEKIAYSSRVGKNFRIKIYDLNTKKTEEFTSGEGSQEGPTWSPDGRFIAYSQTDHNQRAEIFIKKVGGEKTRQLTFLIGNGFSPAWAPYPTQ